MHELLKQYAAELESTPEAPAILANFDRGLITARETLKALEEAADNAQYFFTIQYQPNPGQRWKAYTDTEYTHGEAAAELERLREAAPGFSWRTQRHFITE